jgi:hypothetical protein
VCRLEVGEKMIVEEDQSIAVDIIDENIESEDVSEEIVSSVGVTQGEEERRSLAVGKGRSLREDFQCFLSFCDFLSSMMKRRVIVKRKMRMLMNSQKKLKKISFQLLLL